MLWLGLVVLIAAVWKQTGIILDLKEPQPANVEECTDVLDKSVHFLILKSEVDNLSTSLFYRFLKFFI